MSSSKKICSTNPAPRPGVGVISMRFTTAPKREMSIVDTRTSVRTSLTAAIGAIADTVSGPSRTKFSSVSSAFTI
jgi:hypothetical protein|eukprot:31378-Pelagococcus_subviridis.AAC.1